MTTPGTQRPTWRHVNFWKINWQAVVGVLLIIAAAYSSATTYQTGQRAQATAECQTEINTQFLEVLKTYDEARRATNDAQRRLLTANQGGDPQAGARARAEYIASLDALEQVRRETPFPEVRAC